MIELIRITWGFSLTQDHKNSLEKDRSFGVKMEEDPVESEEETEVFELLVQVKEEKEDEEVAGEGGDIGDILLEGGMIGVLMVNFGA